MTHNKIVESDITIQDKELLKKLKTYELNIVNIIYQNQRKQRYTLLVEKNDEFYVMKWNSKENSTHLAMLKKEIKFLEKNQELYFPNLVYSEENLLLLNYLEGCTLREWVQSYRESKAKNELDTVSDEFMNIVDGLTEYVKGFYSPDENSVSDIDISKTYESYFNKLYFSSPMSKKKSMLERFILKINRKINRGLLESKFNKLEQMYSEKNLNKFSGLIHADLHLNNIYIKPDLTVKVLDWENVTNSSFFFDWNYLFCFMMFLLEGLTKHQEYLLHQFEKMIEEKFDETGEMFFRTNDIFMLGISTNRDFGYNISFIKFIKRILLFRAKLKRV